MKAFTLLSLPKSQETIYYLGQKEKISLQLKKPFEITGQ